MRKKIHTHKFRIRYVETDQMGHVHHSHYAKYFEMGRIEWFRNLGFDYKNIENQGVILPVLQLSIDFKKALFFDELITVITEISAVPTYFLEFKYTLTDKDDKVRARGTTKLIFINKETQKPMRCPSKIKEALNFF